MALASKEILYDLPNKMWSHRQAGGVLSREHWARISAFHIRTSTWSGVEVETQLEGGSCSWHVYAAVHGFWQHIAPRFQTFQRNEDVFWGASWRSSYTQAKSRLKPRLVACVLASSPTTTSLGTLGSSQVHGKDHLRGLKPCSGLRRILPRMQSQLAWNLIQQRYIGEGMAGALHAAACLR